MIELIEVNKTYEPFSLEPQYIDQNRQFLGRPDLSNVRHCLDIACGNGVSAEMLLQSNPMIHLNGVDYDPKQIDLIEERFTELGYSTRRGFGLTDEFEDGKPVLTFGECSGDELPFAEDSFDCVTIANAIHMLPDKDKFIRSAAEVLRPGGLFGFNSSFYAGTFPADTDRFYTNWLMLAAQALTRHNKQLVAQGKPPLKRIRKTSHRAFQNRWLTIDEWTELLQRYDLEIFDLRETVVMLDARCFITISAYAGMAEVLLSGYPVEEASWALQSTVEPALEAFGTDQIPRNWLEVWATKKR